MWILISLISAFGWATSDAFVKAAYKRCKLNEYFVIWVRYFFSLPFILIPFMKIKIPELDTEFFLWHIVWIPLETLALYLYVKAISLSEISISLPFLSFTPLFLIFSSYLIIGEQVSPGAAVGILLIVTGSYTMGIRNLKRGFFEPIKNVMRNKGVRLIVLVAFLYSITSIAGKMLVLHSNPVFFSFYYTLVMNLVLIIPGIRGARTSDWQRCWKLLLFSGLFYAIMTLAHMTAIKMTLVSYMIAIKRLSGIISVFYGWLFFREKEIPERLMGSILMVIGAILITLSS